ncbi:MAG TPA: nitroreductase family protein, partial [Candidatus Paceibacterota bacterium]|nr:nitroreductase family protein [Candidatus Paceibacterota bacterium]
MPQHIRTILEAATQAPSGENVQPWHFHVRDFSHKIIIDVYLSKDNDHSLYGWGDRASYVAIGAAMENLRIMAAQIGWQSTYVLFPHSGDRKHVARFELYEQKSSYGDGLASYIERRVTNRKAYYGKPLAPEDIRALIDSNKEVQYGNVRIATDEGAIEELAEVGAGNELIMLNNETLHNFFFSHVNWTKKDDDDK